MRSVRGVARTVVAVAMALGLCSSAALAGLVTLTDFSGPFPKCEAHAAVYTNEGYWARDDGVQSAHAHLQGILPPEPPEPPDGIPGFFNLDAWAETSVEGGVSSQGIWLSSEFARTSSLSWHPYFSHHMSADAFGMADAFAYVTVTTNPVEDTGTLTARLTGIRDVIPSVNSWRCWISQMGTTLAELNSIGQEATFEVQSGILEIDLSNEVGSFISDWPGGTSEIRVDITPEPATLSLLALGGLVVLRRRR